MLRTDALETTHPSRISWLPKRTDDVICRADEAGEVEVVLTLIPGDLL